MAHSNNVISSIKLPGVETPYEIHDAHAIHNIEDLGLSAALVFKGTETNINNVKTAKAGDVYLIGNVEYVCIKEFDVSKGGSVPSNAWEKLGNIHDAASTTHIHNITVAGSNADSAVTGNVIVPTYSATAQYVTASATAPGLDYDKKTITASASGTVVEGDGTVKAITGFADHSTKAALGTDATFKATGGKAQNQKMVTSTASKVTATPVSIPNVVTNEDVKASKVTEAGSKTDGQPASWSASVDANGVLSFSWTANVPTAVTLPTFTEVTATNTTLGTALSASSVSAQDVTVATGAVGDDGEGASITTGISSITVEVNDAKAITAITGLGTPTKEDVLTGVKVATQPTITLTNATNVVTGDITASAPNVTLNSSGATSNGAISVIPSITVGSTSVALQNGVAKAQTWTANVSVSGPTEQQ